MRDIHGRFIETTGNARYKKIERNGKAMQLSRFVWENANGKIPKGKMIHHINGNKKDDRLENLQLTTYKWHNGFHHCGKIPWNKGKVCPNMSKAKLGHLVSKEQIAKAKETWKNKYLPSMKKIHSLKEKGLSYPKIAKELGLTVNCVSWRHLKYIRDYCGGGGNG